jgi:dTMP kinase
MKPAPPVTTARTAPYRKAPVFISFEGQDWSGKSTQAALLAESLQAEGCELVSTREPGGTPVGEAIRALVLEGPEMSAWAEASLFAAARAEHVAAVIRPALERGDVVICDRYVDSSIVYQGIARGLGAKRVLELNLAVTGGLLPDRTFVLNVDPVTARARHSAGLDRIEREDDAFRAVVADGYRQLATLFPERVVALDGTLSPEEIAAHVRDHVRTL